ncbi:MAG: cache domain-containing sensor histidine kinase [Saccharofermentanales bacterium]
MINKKQIGKLFFFGLRTKMLVLFSIIIVFSNSFILFFSVSRYSQKLEDNSIKNAEQVLGNLIGNLEEYIKDVENITDLAVYNFYIQDYLGYLNNKDDGETPADKIQNAQMGVALLGNIISTRNDISSIFIFNDDGIALYKTSPLDINTDFDYKNQSWYKIALSNPDRIFLTGPHPQVYAKANPNSVYTISRSVNSYDGSGSLGVVVVDSNLQQVQSYCNSIRLSNNGYVFIINREGKIIYHPDSKNSLTQNMISEYQDIQQHLLPEMRNSTEGTFNGVISGEKHQIVYKTMNITDWLIVTATPNSNITDDASNIRNLVFFAGIICLILVTIISIVLSGRITKPLTHLKSAMDKADHGNLDVRVPVESNDEIGLLSDSFNTMLERLDGLVHQTIADQEEKRKLELKALQHQIDPHFLYNTLDSIIWMAEAKDPNVVPMTEALSRLFRISLSRGQEMLTLSDELEHVRNYLFIQSMRYLNKFDYEITSPEDLSNCKTIKLILQPFVENSLYHGIKNKSTRGHIYINAFTVDDTLVITISDDGIGMDEETCKRILQPPTSEASLSKSGSGSGFGIRNVNERIKLYFGDKYGVRFESEIGVGTTAFIYLPIIRENQ